MYGRGALIGVASASTTTAAVTMLPNTGSSYVISLAISVAVGLIVWGALYARAK